MKTAEVRVAWGRLGEHACWNLLFLTA
jgi:hypothetical protein